ncbi:MAG: multicopper oxidase domain-containing protein [Flavobacteriales bacterium]|jgi:FtsP/CotA-like multicopper oxidase with cupredoxin domain|nr:multicopper oxidase domain-containing protein [Flavobacteriales bacterium]MBP8877194.1 multicopper oxidase domain-containing protein [Flavobacteriales bacterium]
MQHRTPLPRSIFRIHRTRTLLMKHRSLLLLPFAIAFHAGAQNPLAIPAALDLDTFDLVVDEHMHQFYPGLTTPTFGVNGVFLGPTLILHHGDTAHIRVINQLEEFTTLHWHGMQVPGESDGGPPRMVMPGETWHVKYKVKNPAGTFWYHPHPHEQTAEQVNMGLAGMIIVQDDAEAALDLPRTYGVDDIPVVVQDRSFDTNGDFIFGPLGDSLLVNGTPHPYVELPAQIVRLRVLNGSNTRTYQYGFEDGRSFSIIANDGGLLASPISTDRLRQSNGERSDILLDLAGMEGDSLLLMSFATELTPSMPGSDYGLWEPSALSGIDFPVLRIRVTAQTSDPVTTIPTTLVAQNPPLELDISRTRYKSFGGTGTVGTGMFTINDLMFDIDVVNDTVWLGATEKWVILNGSDIAHPFHMHGGSFYVLNRDGMPPLPWETGAKDVILVDMAEQVHLIMKFDELSNGWPFMYHCHNLMHEDMMMMLQYVVEDNSTSVADPTSAEGVTVFPSPSFGLFTIQSDFALKEATVTDLMGRTVIRTTLNNSFQAELDASTWPTGPYVLELLGTDRSVRKVVVRQ